jgi:hypothetical protein
VNFSIWRYQRTVVSSTKGGKDDCTNGSAKWRGNVKSGLGTVKVGNGVFEGTYSYGSRFGEERRRIRFAVGRTIRGFAG